MSARRIKMFEYSIPFHIQEEIMKRLPVKSLILFRSVSKAWKSLIDSSEFIAAHSLHHHTQPQHLFVSHQDLVGDGSYVCYIDDDTFPQQRSLPTLPPPLSAKQILIPRVVGSSRGLLCLHGYYPNHKTWAAVVWNPSIRKSIVVDVPANPLSVGFGVCPVTNDPKMVSIIPLTSSRKVPKTICRFEVMVYTLSSGKWRTLSTNLPTTLKDWCSVVIVTERFIYWRAVLPNHYIIVSFNVTNENLEVIDLPDSLALRDLGYLYISKLRGSLAIIQSHENTYTVWMMEDGVQRSFTKLFTIKTPHSSIVGFRKNGTPIMQVRCDGDPEDDDNDYEAGKLIVYEPNLEHKNVLDICPLPDTFNVNSYMETLVLLSRSDCSSY